MRSLRVRHVALAAATIVVGLAVHLRAPLGPVVRDVLGDALWASMMFWWISAAAPRVGRPHRGAIALAVCWLVEFGQLVSTPSLDAVRRTLPGHLVLGSGFDPRDLAAYAAGVVAALLVDRALSGRARRRPGGDGTTRSG